MSEIVGMRSGCMLSDKQMQGGCFTSVSRCAATASWSGLFPRAPCTARSGYVMNKKLKSIPKFRNEAEERRFWQTHDSSDYIDWTKAARVRFPNLKPSTTAISLRLPVTILERIKVAANKRDVPYQSLIKTWLAEKTGTR